MSGDTTRARLLKAAEESYRCHLHSNDYSWGTTADAIDRETKLSAIVKAARALLAVTAALPLGSVGRKTTDALGAAESELRELLPAEEDEDAV